MEPRTLFSDGLGERRQTSGTGNQPLDVLILHAELTAVPAFEAAVRERVDQLSAFQHPAFARIRGVGRLAKTPTRLAIASDHVRGTRLSELLEVAERRLIPLEIAAASHMVRQVMHAVTALHESVPEATHGAIGPERVVVTPDGNIVLVEHVLGSALEQLRFSHDRYWKELRIPLPLAGGLPRFDRRADVTQLGALALALVLGRPLIEEEYPSRIADIVDGVRAISAGGLEMLSSGMRSWLSRTLQLDPRRSFATAIDAQVELEAMPHDEDRGREAVLTFLAQCREALAPPAAAAVPAPPLITPIAEPVAAPSAASVEPMEPAASLAAPAFVEPADAPAPTRWRYRLAAAMILIALASVGTLAARRYFTAAETGTLVVETTPAGIDVLIDGEARGTSPLTIDLPTGHHTIEIAAPACAPLPAVVETPREAAAAPVAPPRTEPSAPATGWVAVSAPLPVQVFEGGRLLGEGSGRLAMPAGRHDLEIVNDGLGLRMSRTVQVSPGVVAPLRIEIPQGTMSFNAQPWADVWLDGQRIGETPIGNHLTSIGDHEVVFRHPELGEQRFSVRVTLTAPARVTADMRSR